MNAKIAATITALVGATGAIIGLLAAFGVDLTEDQLNAILGLGGLVTAITGIWLHPSVPVGVSASNPEG